jgi:hypothetical protein
MTGLDRLDATQRCMLGIAGSVATHLWRGGCIDDYLPDEEISESDWRLARHDPNAESDDIIIDAIDEVGRLLDLPDGPLWRQLIVESRRLIVSSRPDAPRWWRIERDAVSGADRLQLGEH